MEQKKNGGRTGQDGNDYRGQRRVPQQVSAAEPYRKERVGRPGMANPWNRQPTVESEQRAQHYSGARQDSASVPAGTGRQPMHPTQAKGTWQGQWMTVEGQESSPLQPMAPEAYAKRLLAPGLRVAEPHLQKGNNGLAQSGAYMQNPLEEDSRWEDPEFVWRQKEKQFFEQMARSGGNRRRRGEYDDSPDPGKGNRAVPVRLLLALLGVACAAAVFRLDVPGSQQARGWVKTSLTSEIDFGTVAAWYEQRFGSVPSFLPAFGNSHRKAQEASSANVARLAAPASGTILSSYTKETPYLLLQTVAHAPIRAVDTGRIAFAGVRDNSGYTIVIQHPGGLQSTYGYLTPGSWEPSDWVSAGDVIGTPASDRGATPRLYFAVSRDNQTVNPEEVVVFD